jgi:DNA-binding response OmpR family regulator
MQGKSKILAVDDDRLLRMTIQMALEEDGYDVDTASGVGDARDALDRHRYDLVLTDLNLPDGDGLQVARHAIRSNPETRVVLMTASEEELDEIAVLEAGIVELVYKSSQLSRLLSRARRALEGGRAEVDAG